MNVKTCPDCKKKLKATELLCECGYDYTMDDCPGCDKRIPEGTIVCPHCAYDLLEGVPASAKPIKAPKPPKQSKVEPKPIPAVVRRQTYGTTTYTVALGHMGQPDSSYPECFWPKDQEVTDDNLREWAENFRAAYSEKCPGRQGMLPNNVAVYGWCSAHAAGHAHKHGKAGQNDVLRDNAARILKLMGGREEVPA